MYNFFNRHYIFRRSDGEMRDIYCDVRQNLCSSRLSGKNSLPETAVIARNVHPHFYAELDEHNVYHVVFQDNEGNINYIYMDGQWSRITPVLGSKTPAVYNKQLYIAPFKNCIYIFYVLQHDNSFLLAYQTVVKNKVSTPKIVDYVSGSNIPCSVVYDQDENIYAFYQSYDGKYLQLGYKKMDTARKHWSDFISVTKYMGNCEYPHAMIDTNGTIHLCYQRRTQKQYELVYQQKEMDRNLWSSETVLHSSVHPFENSSVVQAKDKINVYWIRDDVIYYVAAGMNGASWSRPARYANQPGRNLQCICWKEQNGAVVSERQGQGTSAASRASSPGIFPGTLSNGVRLAFLDVPVSKTWPQISLYESSGRESGSYTDDIRDNVMNSIKQLQEEINEVSTGWSGAKKELVRMTNTYMDISRELNKLSLRLNLVENKLKELSNPYKSAVVIAGDKTPAVGDSPFEGAVIRRPDALPPTMSEQKAALDENEPGPQTRGPSSEDQKRPSERQGKETNRPSTENNRPAAEDIKKPEKPGLSLDPEARKIWEEWQEPKEWSEGS